MCHVFPDVFFSFVFDVGVDLQVLKVLAVLQLLVHDAMSQLHKDNGLALNDILQNECTGLSLYYTFYYEDEYIQ